MVAFALAVAAAATGLSLRVGLMNNGALAAPLLPSFDFAVYQSYL